MYSNYNYYPMPQQQQPMTQPNYMRNPMMMGNNQSSMLLKGHPVSSFDEAKAASIDFDGSVFFFPDPANKCIYTKQINMDGTSTISVYEYKNQPSISNNSSSDYITREEFEYVISQLKDNTNNNSISNNTQQEVKF